MTRPSKWASTWVCNTKMIFWYISCGDLNLHGDLDLWPKVMKYSFYVIWVWDAPSDQILRKSTSNAYNIACCVNATTILEECFPFKSMKSSFIKFIIFREIYLYYNSARSSICMIVCPQTSRKPTDGFTLYLVGRCTSYSDNTWTTFHDLGSKVKVTTEVKVTVANTLKNNFVLHTRVIAHFEGLVV